MAAVVAHLSLSLKHGRTCTSGEIERGERDKAVTQRWWWWMHLAQMSLAKMSLVLYTTRLSWHSLSLFLRKRLIQRGVHRFLNSGHEASSLPVGWPPSMMIHYLRPLLRHNTMMVA